MYVRRMAEDISDTSSKAAPGKDPFDGVRWDMTGAMSYGGYLQLDRLLDAQRPLSGERAKEPL